MELIRYETDNGYFFNNFKNFSGVGMSEIISKSDYVSSSLGEIAFQQSEKIILFIKEVMKKFSLY